MSTFDPATDPAHRLGAAHEFIRQLADPDSALSVGIAVDGIDYARRQAADFLARAGATPTVYPDATRIPMRRVIAAQVPWPALAVHGLWPGDRVVHDDHGPGVVEGFNHTEWPDVLELVAGGQVLVDFDRSGGVWVRASELTRTSEADPVF